MCVCVCERDRSGAAIVFAIADFSLQPHVVAFAPALPKLSGPPCSDSMKQDYIFIVNPKGANGNTGREWKRLFPKLSARLGKDWNVCESLTSGPLHAVDIAREAIKGGAAAVVAVGGDGTLNEVVNGFFEDGRLVQSKDGIAASRTALGLIPLGTGSDFARTLGWKNDPVESIERITKGKKRAIDVGCVKADSSLHYFINVADLHLSAKAGYHAGKYKTFGNLCYVIGALQAFMGHKDKDMNIRMDGGNWKLTSKVTSIAIGNAKYFGGGMKITPTADLSSGELEVVALQDFKWHDFLLNLPKLYKGTHISVRNVSSSRVHTIDVMEAPSSDGGALKNDTYVQADGEHIGFLPATFSVIPGAIDLLV